MEKKFRSEQEKVALEFLSAMGVSRPFSDLVKLGVEAVAKFFSDFHTCPALYTYIKRFEEEKGGLVYYATKESFPWGECITLLYVSRYEEDWGYQMPRLVNGEENQYVASAWVWNMTEDWRSEFGSVIVMTSYGMLFRLG